MGKGTTRFGAKAVNSSIVVVVVVVCSHINSQNQIRGHRTGPSHSGAEEYPREKTQIKSSINSIPL